MTSSIEMPRVLALAAALALALLVPGTAGAADPFGANPSDIQPSQQTTPAQTTSSSTSSSSGLSGGSKTALLVGAGVILFGIAFVIVRDARRVAPTRRHDAAPGGAGARPATPAAPGARGRPTGKASAAKRRRAKRR